MALAGVIALIAGLLASGPAAQADQRHQVEIESPTSVAPVTAAAGESIEVAFSTDGPWRYSIDARAAGGAGDWQLLDGDAAEGRAERGENTVDAVVPVELEPGHYDLRLRIFLPNQRPDPRELGSTTVGTALQVVPEQLPETGFESRGDDGTTTNDEELAFLDAVAAASPRVAVSAVGESSQGRPLNLVRLGHPAPPADERMAERSNVLVIGGQHGNEPAGREMALQLLRDLAFTDDPELIEQLSETAILVLPNANPDGVAANTRRNGQGLDINRDHLNLRTPEAQTIAQVLQEFTPDLTLDAHEGSPRHQPEETPWLRIAWQRNLNVDDQLYDLNVDLVEDYVFPGVQAAGFPDTDHYGSPDDGEESSQFLSQSLGLRHGLGLLIESFGGTLATRVDLQLATAHESLRFQRERADAVAQVVAEAPGRAAARGENQSEPFFMRGADWDTQPPPADMVLDPPPCGYLLNTYQAEQIEQHTQAFGIATERVSEESVFLTMAQPMMTLIPDLVDERGRSNEVEGLALADCSDPGAVDPPPPPPPGSPDEQYATDFSTDVVGAAPADWSSWWNDSAFAVLDDPSRLHHDVQDREPGDGRQALVLDAVGEDGVVRGDVEVAAMVRGEGDTTLFQLGLNVSGTGPGEANAFYVDARVNGSSANHLRINQHQDGSFGTLASAPLPFSVDEDTWYHVVLQRDGDELRAKLWPAGTDEPEHWSVLAQSRSFDEGRIGVMHFTAGAQVEYAFVGVGVGAESAPRPPDDLLE